MKSKVIFKNLVKSSIGKNKASQLKKIVTNVLYSKKKFLVKNMSFPGGRGQQLRSRQIEIISSLTNNRTFISRYPELLTCNECYLSVADKIDVSFELKKYFEKAKDWMIYPDQINSLEAWKESNAHVWPDIHPAHRHIVQTFRVLNPKTVCDVGAGAGVVAKYVYASSNKNIKLSCVEGSKTHMDLMKLNFSQDSKIFPPQIEVNAEIIEGLAQNLHFEDNSYEFVYTCTVMMHMPFIAAVLAACEIARISSKFVLHVEGYHTSGIARFRTPYNLLLIDYERLYNKLGFRTLKKYFYQTQKSPDFDFIVFLCEKQVKNKMNTP